METVQPKSLLDGSFGRSIKHLVSAGQHATALFAGSTGTVGAAAKALNLGLSVLKKGMSWYKCCSVFYTNITNMGVMLQQAF